ncbi:Fic family protein [Propionivibrio sp.]|uniref:Fic family protein n=1 Tax=Propionivibrio sp. TaxID=2212460 RepID=UPI0039E2FEF4
MQRTPLSQYTQAHQFEPLLPQFNLEPLRARSRAVIEQSLKLTASVHPDTIASLCELVREMNSYYSNRIEGQSTHPRNISRALHRDFSDRPDVARLQRVALAHIEAEKELEAGLLGEDGTPGTSPLSSAFVQKAHAALYGRLEAADRLTAENQAIEPGRFRAVQVAVGRHEPPPPEALGAFLKRFDEVYTRPGQLEDTLLIAASAHQRMAWIHPFVDGNGRATRLQTHCALWSLSRGLWSVSRGLARQRDEYYERLDAADAPRQGDLDGRGNLSEKALRRWCEWFIGVCEDQVGFMTRMFNLDEMKTRIQALIAFRASQDRQIRPEAVLPLHHLFLAGPTPRGEFQQMTGLGERTARSLLSRLLETGLVTSAGHVAPVRFAFPLDALQFLLPDLYPEAAARID